MNDLISAGGIQPAFALIKLRYKQALSAGFFKNKKSRADFLPSTRVAQ